MSAPDLVIAGNLLVDDVVSDDGSARFAVAGGALLHAALGATLWGASVGLVSVLGTDYPVAALDLLRARGARLDGVRRLDGPGVRVWLLYEEGIRRMIPHLGRPDHDAVSPAPEDVPDAFRGARAFHVAPMPLARQLAMARAISAEDTLLSVDPCDHLGPASLPAFRELAERVDVLFLSDDEIAIDDEDGVLRDLAARTRRFLLHKRGADGGIVLRRDGTSVPWRATSADAVDPTGAGDAFAAAFVHALAAGASLDDALARAAVTGALAVEGHSATSLELADHATIQQRLAEARAVAASLPARGGSTEGGR